ncbi:MAG: DUF5908 family protein [Flavisolibacter sp.]
MAVQINEVIIKTVVDPTPISTGSNSADCPPATDDDETLEKVLNIIREKLQR